VLGAETEAEVAVVFDWDNRWAIDATCGPRREKKEYLETCQAHYRAYWRQGIAADVIHSESDLSRYRVVVAPLLYMLRPGVAEALETFAANGGCVVVTYWSGLADEDDLIFEGGQPGPLRRLLGVRVEEIDVLYDDEKNTLVTADKSYVAHTLCELAHAETAEVLARYGEDFYAGRPALTRNRFGAGEAYYLAARTDDEFLTDFHASLADRLGLARAFPAPLPEGVTARRRGSALFLMNFTAEPREISGFPNSFRDFFDGTLVNAPLTLPPYATRVLSDL
jgi:beta-galactosidase